MPGSPTGQQEVFSTAQMTQIAQIVSLSLNQAMGEFNMRLNGLQQQVVHQQNVFAQAQVQQAASQPAQVPVAKTSPSISSGLSSFGDRPPSRFTPGMFLFQTSSELMRAHGFVHWRQDGLRNPLIP